MRNEKYRHYIKTRTSHHQNAVIMYRFWWRRYFHRPASTMAMPCRKIARNRRCRYFLMNSSRRTVDSTRRLRQSCLMQFQKYQCYAPSTDLRYRSIALRYWMIACVLLVKWRKRVIGLLRSAIDRYYLVALEFYSRFWLAGNFGFSTSGHVLLVLWLIKVLGKVSITCFHPFLMGHLLLLSLSILGARGFCLVLPVWSHTPFYWGYG